MELSVEWVTVGRGDIVNFLALSFPTSHLSIYLTISSPTLAIIEDLFNMASSLQSGRFVLSYLFSGICPNIQPVRTKATRITVAASRAFTKAGPTTKAASHPLLFDRAITTCTLLINGSISAAVRWQTQHILETLECIDARLER